MLMFFFFLFRAVGVQHVAHVRLAGLSQQSAGQQHTSIACIAELRAVARDPCSPKA